MKNTAKSRLMIAVLIIALSLIFFVCGILMLPDTLAMQIGNNPTTMPKPLGLLIPLAISVIFSVMYSKEGGSKSLILAIVGVALNAFTFVYNFWFIG